MGCSFAQGTIKPLKLFQTLAILEILHAGFGLVRAPVMTTGEAATVKGIVHTLAFAPPTILWQSIGGYLDVINSEH